MAFAAREDAHAERVEDQVLRSERDAPELAVGVSERNVVRVALDLLVRDVDDRADAEAIGQIERRADRLLDAPADDRQSSFV